MKRLLELAYDFVKADDGPTAAEYALMLAMIIIACFVAIETLSGKVQTTFETMASGLPDGTAPA